MLIAQCRRIVCRSYPTQSNQQQQLTLCVVLAVFPTFVKTPEDKTVRAGTTARLDCAATGQPPPQISWQKDGGSDFPAARERRMYVKPTDDAFFIVRFRSTDQGVYSCTATNAAGTIMANVTLSVLGGSLSLSNSLTVVWVSCMV